MTFYEISTYNIMFKFFLTEKKIILMKLGKTGEFFKLGF